VILTVTPHPALDYTIRLDALEIGKRARYRDPAIDPTGKGINVARMVRRLGEPVLALGFAGGATGGLLVEGLDLEGVPHELVRVEGAVRINVTLLTGPEGTATHLHGPGGAVTEADGARLREAVAAKLPGARILVLSGSLPPGLGPGFAAGLVRLAGAQGVPALLDAEGEVLAAGLSEKPAIVKVNLDEATRLLGGTPDLLAAARGLLERGAGTAVVTRGAEGAVAARGREAWRVVPPREAVARAVGAGDSFAAGLAVGLARGLGLPEALRLAGAAGAATARSPGTGLGHAEDVAVLAPRVGVESIKP
jgi:1-phosphofructokinase family hexose kinase